MTTKLTQAQRRALEAAQTLEHAPYWTGKTLSALKRKGMLEFWLRSSGELCFHLTEAGRKALEVGAI